MTVGQHHLRDSQAQAEPLDVGVGHGQEPHEGEDVPLRHVQSYNREPSIKSVGLKKSIRRTATYVFKIGELFYKSTSHC